MSLRIVSLLILTVFTVISAKAQIVNIPDANFKNALLNTNCVDTDGFGGFDADADTNDDGEIQVTEAQAVLRLNLSGQNIQSLQGILEFTNLETLFFNNNNVNETLDFTSLTNLEELEAVSNQIPSVNVSNLVNLDYLELEANVLTSVDFSGCTNLSSLGLGSNQLTGTINLNGFSNLVNVRLFNNQITAVSTQGLTSVYEFVCRDNNITSLDLTDSPDLRYVDCDDNQITNLNLMGLDFLTGINCENNQLTSLDIEPSLPNLTAIFCDFNQITSLDVTGHSNLVILDCPSNQLTTLNVNALQNLEQIKCSNNQISQLEVSNLPSLVTFWCSGNQIQNLDLDASVNLDRLYCSSNALTTLNIGNSVVLDRLYVSDNQFTDLNLEANSSITRLDCGDNQLTSLDLSALRGLDILYCENNQLEQLFIKNGAVESYLSFNNNPNLTYVCGDENQVEDLQLQLSNYNYTNCVLNSYCSFVPGGEYYNLTGESRADFDANGCDNTDAIYPNVKINVSNAEASATYISNDLGSYAIPLQAGMHTIVPVLEDLDYYTVTPNSSSIEIIDSDLVQDFCIVSDGISNDLDIVLISLETPRPGFDVDYRLIYKNKGNTVLSGSVVLDYNANADTTTFLSANPSETTNTSNQLTWDFLDLQPFETREIAFSFNLNPPTDPNFPLNSGDILNYVCTVNPVSNDETPEDNVFVLEETVVNSYDPNDIRCLEGETIVPEKVGEYVHYLIRFENLGTANAINVVVRDIIDDTKFDVSTLIPLNASHSFITRITEGNIVEFIFENIQLPFDDANNDGYVLFKIKTLETLQLGDTFAQQAEIYFDFNFPVITNNYTTVVEENLSTNDFEINDVKLFPNPVSNKLRITSGLNIDTIKIFDIKGRLISTKTNTSFNTETEILVSSFTSGVYFIELYVKGQKEVFKFVKK